MDKDILFSEEAQAKLAELFAQMIMPELKYLKDLSIPDTNNVEIKEEDGKFTWSFKLKE